MMTTQWFQIINTNGLNTRMKDKQWDEPPR